MKFLPGDIAACYGTELPARCIELATASLLAPTRLRIGPSHVAMICEHRQMSMWVESTSLCRHPCLIQQQVVRGVQAHQPEARIHDYLEQGGRIDFYRLSPIFRLSNSESHLLTTVFVKYFVRRGVDYDFGGALLSGTRGLKRSRLFPGADLDQLFCSELLAAVLMRLGRLNHGNPTKYNPADLLRELVRQGTYQFDGTASAMEGSDFSRISDEVPT